MPLVRAVRWSRKRRNLADIKKLVRRGKQKKVPIERPRNCREQASK
jgi:hypothetical protein